MDMRSNRGSVLMEFIIVLPIYMILMGMAFFYGELSLHGVNLAASADRTAAVVRGGEGWSGWNGYSAASAETAFARAISPFREHFRDEALTYREEGTSARPSSYTRRHFGEVEDSSFKGAWTWLVAATVEDNYAMTPWTRGMVGTWAHLERLVKMENAPQGLGSDSVLNTLFGGSGNLGRVAMTGKDCVNVGARVYSYYTLTRNSKARSPDTPYRQWYPGNLVDDDVGGRPTWRECVYGEPWQLAKNYKTLQGENKGADPGFGTYRRLYNRYGQYKTWSD